MDGLSGVFEWIGKITVGRRTKGLSRWTINWLVHSNWINESRKSSYWWRSRRWSRIGIGRGRTKNGTSVIIKEIITRWRRRIIKRSSHWKRMIGFRWEWNTFTSGKGRSRSGHGRRYWREWRITSRGGYGRTNGEYCSWYRSRSDWIRWKNWRRWVSYARSWSLLIPNIRDGSIVELDGTIRSSVIAYGSITITIA